MYYIYSPITLIYPDTIGYFNNAVKLKTGDPLFVLFSDERVPFYPIIIHSVTHAKHLYNLYDPQRTIPHHERLVLLNILFGLGTICFATLIVNALFKSQLIVFVLGCIIASNSAFLYWEHSVLPESLATFLFTALVYFSIIGFIKQSLPSVIFLTAISILLFLTKPIFLFLPMAIFFVFMVQYKKRKLFFYSIICLFMYCGVIFIYVAGNMRYHGYRGINHASDINLLGRIMQLHPPIQNNTSFFSTSLQTYWSLNKELNPYRFLEWSNPAIYGTGTLLEELRIFTQSVVKRNFLSYIVFAIPDIIPSLTDYEISTDMITNKASATISIIFFRSLHRLHIIIHYLGISLIVFFPINIYVWVLNTLRKRQTGIHYGTTLIVSGAVMYVVILAALGSYDSFGRLTTPSVPILFIAIASSITQLICIRKIEKC